MKKLGLIILITALLAFPSYTQASPPDYTGGIHNEYEYQELVFINGTPVKFAGSGKDFSIKRRDKDDSSTITYRIKLTPVDPMIDGELDRSITYKTTYALFSDKGQTTAQMEVDKYKEEIELEGDKYRLEDYQFSKSDVIDNRPASDYYSGSLTARKVYSINKSEGQVVVEITGGTVGYENFWGSTETQQLEYIIQVDRQLKGEEKETKPEPVSWEGTVTVQVADSMSKSLQYSDNEATLSSFAGGHLRVTNQEMYSSYKYNLPVVDEGKPVGSSRQTGQLKLNKQMVPRVERLIVPKFRDIGGHWAEEDIQKLYSLDVFEGNAQFFAPEVPMSRIDFTRAIVKGANMRIDQPDKKVLRSRRREPEVSPFIDLPATDTNYSYVKEAVNKGIISGITPNRFGPEQPLNRAQAITIIIRALGFESQAPTPGYTTSFADDYQIPEWSRDAIYMAREIGLVSGDAYNRINPQQVLTRAEASAMLVSFLNFLERDLQKDYREDIILYR
ncbi:S-layer homology domain-containing protein [Syntrophomonas erecta subsp. sporosyntropha]